ncbi:MAG: hypothetical protein WAL63_05285 [Solirubrobacteraceae bacterium]
MSFSRSFGGSLGGEPDRDPGAAQEWVEERRATRSGELCAGTLACERCDAPVAIGPEAHLLTDELVCPFCDHAAPVRQFLSLEPPTRPTRVVVRLSLPRIAGG